MSQTTITSHGNTSPAFTAVPKDSARSTEISVAKVHQQEPGQDRAYVERIDELREMAREQHAALDRVIEQHPPHLAGYFLVVFIFGLLMSQWALLSGHAAAWLCGLVISVSGLAIAVGSVVSQIRYQGKTINKLKSTPVTSRENQLDHAARRHSRLRLAVQDSKKASA